MRTPLATTIEEGRAAYVLGSAMTDNPYRAAMRAMRRGPGKIPIDPNDPYGYNEPRFAGLTTLAFDWDSGYAVASRNAGGK